VPPQFCRHFTDVPDCQHEELVGQSASVVQVGAPGGKPVLVAESMQA
jgi:hypothetical protein